MRASLRSLFVVRGSQKQLSLDEQQRFEYQSGRFSRTPNSEQRTALGGGRNLNVRVSITPEEWDAGEPILCLDGVPHAGGVFDRQDAGRGRKFRAGDFSANRAGSDFDLRIIADALDLAELAVRHEVEFVALFREPDGCGDGDSGFAEGGERDVFLSVDRTGDGHGHIVINAGRGIVGAANV